MKRPLRDRAAALLAEIRGGSVVLDLVDEITQDTIAPMLAKLRAAPNAARVELFVDSPGGEIAAAFSLFDAIRAHGAREKVAHGTGAVQSAAALVFAACDRRILYPDATVLLHAADVDPPKASRWTAPEYEKKATYLAALDAGIAETLATRCTVSASIILREMRDEWSMTPERALRIGLATDLAEVNK